MKIGSIIACLGPPGSFSQQSLLDMMGDQQPKLHFVNNLDDLFTALDNKEVDFAWLPWWNSGCGFLTDSFKREFFLMLIHSKKHYVISAENSMPLHFSLLVKAGAKMEDIRTIYVNPYCYALCKQFFRTHPQLKVVTKDSSSEAAKEVAEANDISIAASASPSAAKLYNLEVLQKTILAEV